MSFLNRQIIIKFLVKHYKKIQAMLWYFIKVLVIGWLSYSILNWIIVTDEQVEASYPTMNQDFGVLVSYLVGKILRTIGYLITVIPGSIYGLFPLPKNFGWMLVLLGVCGSSWIGVRKLKAKDSSKKPPSEKVNEDDTVDSSLSKFDFRAMKPLNDNEE